MAAVPVGVLARPGDQLRAGLSPAARRFARWRRSGVAGGLAGVPAAAGLDAGHRADARSVVERAPGARGLAVSAGGIGRRQLLAAGAAWLAAPAVRAAATAEAEPLDGDPGGVGARGRGPGFALIDLDSGALVEAREPDRGRPPASVAKIVTTLYALDALGPDYRFPTRVLADGSSRRRGGAGRPGAGGRRRSDARHRHAGRAGASVGRAPASPGRPGGSWWRTGRCRAVAEIDARPAGGCRLQSVDLGDQPRLQPGILPPGRPAARR